MATVWLVLVVKVIVNILVANLSVTTLEIVIVYCRKAATTLLVLVVTVTLNTTVVMFKKQVEMTLIVLMMCQVSTVMQLMFIM